MGLENDSGPAATGPTQDGRGPTEVTALLAPTAGCAICGLPTPAVARRGDGACAGCAMPQPRLRSIPATGGHDGRCACGALQPCAEPWCPAAPGHELTCPECMSLEQVR